MDTLARLSRRDLLRSGGVLVVGFTVSSLPLPAWAQTAATTTVPATGKPIATAEVDSFIAIHQDGTATVYTGKVDVGTGLRTAIAQLVAEELGMKAEQITVVDGDTGICPDQGGTGGSTGLTRGGTEVRQAAATAHQALLALGASRLGMPASDLVAINGEVRPRAGGSAVTFGALVGDRPFAVKLDPNAPLRQPSTYSVVGTSVRRPDVRDKAAGTFVYVADVQVPGMMHARVIRPAAPGAALQSVDESSLQGIPGVRVVRVGSFLAVVSADEWAAVRAAQALKATWGPGRALPESSTLQQWTRAGMPERDQRVVDKGDPEVALRTAASTVVATYFWPYQAHASLGPSCAVADVRPDGTATVWSAAQGGQGLKQTLAKVFGLPVDKLRVIFAEGSGSYGTNGSDHVAADAVLISKTIGRPVRVQWMRGDEHAWAPKGPQQLLEIKAGLDATGRIVAWDTQMWLSTNAPGARAFHAADEAGLEQEHGNGAGAITQNADPPYAAEAVRVTAHWIREAPLQLSNLRAPGKIANAFAVEAMTDELAAVAGIDPLEFRLARLSDPRGIEVLRRAAETFGWRPRPGRAAGAGGDTLVGRGVAYVRYKQAENYVATMMEVAVTPRTGDVRVRRVVCAHDCGIVVSPDGLKNQIEGCIIQTLSRALHEEVTFDRTHVTSVDWVSYPILRFPDVPSVEVVLINRPDQPLLGAGEAATAPVAAALANAIYDATGVRMRIAPFTSARMRAALARRGANATG